MGMLRCVKKIGSLCTPTCWFYLDLRVDEPVLATILLLEDEMTKATRINQAFLLKDGVMIQINSAVLKMSHFKPTSTIKNEIELDIEIEKKKTPKKKKLKKS